MIEVKDIMKSYGNGESRFQVLQSISLKIMDGDFVVILGASGSGKSTLLNVISGLERPDSGKVYYDTTDITTFSDNELTAFRKENVGFVMLLIMLGYIVIQAFGHVRSATLGIY